MRLRARTLALGLLAWLGSPAGPFPPNSISAQITVSGVVSGAGEGPLAGAYVYPQKDPGAVVSTNEDGGFTVELPAPDSLLVSFLGYETGRCFASVANPVLRLHLRPARSGSIDALTVRATKIDHGELASARIGQMDIYLDPAAKADPLLAVNRLPAATNPDETANVSLRGSPSEATGIFLNDVPIRSAVRLDQSNGVGQFSLFANIPLREVNVYAGAPPVTFSQTSAGAVALVTEPALPAGPSSAISLHLAGVGLMHARPLGEKTGLRAYANAGNTAAFQTLNEEGLPDLRTSKSFDGAVQLTHAISEGHTIELFYLGFNENYRYDVTTPYYSGEFSQRKPRHLAVMNYRRGLGNWEVAANNAFDWERGRFAFGNSLTRARRWHAHSAINATHRIGGRTLRFGATHNTYDDLTSGRAPTVGYLLSPEMRSIPYAVAEKRSLNELYAYASKRLGDRWLAGAGLKTITLAGEGGARWNAQASLRYRPSASATFHLTGGRFTQLLAPGPTIRTWQWIDLNQVALEYKAGTEAWSWQAAAFVKRELYDLSPDLGVLGAEGQATYEDAAWVGQLSLSAVRNRTLNGDAPTRRDLPFFARAQVRRKLGGALSVGLAATWRRGAVTPTLTGREPIPETDGWFSPIYAPLGDRLPNYRRVDFSASKVFPLGGGSLILYLNVNNLLGAENISGYAYDATFLGRQPQLYSRRLIFLGGVWNW